MRPSTPDRLVSKFAQRWEKGIWIGFDDGSNAHLVLTSRGVVTSRSVRRLPVEAQNQHFVLEEAAGAPWDFKEDPRVDLAATWGERQRQQQEREQERERQSGDAAEQAAADQPSEGLSVMPGEGGQLLVPDVIEPPPGLVPPGYPTLAMDRLPSAEREVKRARFEETKVGPPNPSQRPEAFAAPTTPLGPGTPDPRDDEELRQVWEKRPVEEGSGEVGKRARFAQGSSPASSSWQGLGPVQRPPSTATTSSSASGSGGGAAGSGDGVVLQQLGQPHVLQEGVAFQAENQGPGEVNPSTGQQGSTGHGEQPGLPEPKKVRLAGLERGRIRVETDIGTEFLSVPE